ncbi:hypothetical protein [Streptomyces sp. KL116D]|uniref:hypothetical protein n=1 Tax=Streptomyces sp. KL116D TaxID=3045152 RepID=UPI0035582873
MFTTTVKSVCAQCNSGWMCDLEGAVKPTLLAMVKGELVSNPSRKQEMLATWTLKTSLMCQLMQAKTVQNLPASLYTDLFRDRRPSEQMRVFTAFMPPLQYLNGESNRIQVHPRGDVHHTGQSAPQDLGHRRDLAHRLGGAAAHKCSS